METVTSSHCQDTMLRLNNDRKTSAKYCDITLIIKDHKFPAHKSVLGLLSPFFDKMFHIDMKEKYKFEAEINGVSKEVLEVILDFIYTGNITLSMENVFAVIEAAHFMDLSYVKETCTKYLSNQVNAGNWLSIRAYAKLYDYKELLDKVDELVTGMFLIVLKSEQFVELVVEELKHLLKLQNRKVNSEDEVYKAVIGWINHDVIGREKYTGELLSFINFSKLTLDFLKRVVVNEKLIEKSLSCTRAVLNAITNHPGTDKQITIISLINSFVAVDGISAYKFNTGKILAASLRHVHRGGSAVKHGQCVYVISGVDTKTIEEVKTQSMSVFQAGSVIEHRYDSASVYENNRLYVTGGLYAETSTETGFFSQNKENFFWAWNLSSFQQMNFNRRGHGLVAMIGSIYVVGGNVDIAQSLLRFSFHTNQITVLQPMQYTRVGLSAVILKHEIYAIAGKRDGCNCSNVENFDPLTNVWKSVASLNVPRYRPGACVINGHIVVVGGGSGKIEVYDKENDKWNIVGESESLKDVFAVFPI